MRAVRSVEGVGEVELERAVVGGREQVEAPLPGDERGVGVALAREQHAAQLEAARERAGGVETHVALAAALRNHEDLAFVLEDERVRQVEGLVEGHAGVPPRAGGVPLGPAEVALTGPSSPRLEEEEETAVAPQQEGIGHEAGVDPQVGGPEDRIRPRGLEVER